jgi:hypothetical protein
MCIGSEGDDAVSEHEVRIAGAAAINKIASDRLEEIIAGLRLSFVTSHVKRSTASLTRIKKEVKAVEEVGQRLSP